MRSFKNEAALVSAIGKAVQKSYPDDWVFKVVGNPYQASGVPDLLICHRGRLIGMEVKHQKPGESEAHAFGRVSPQQESALEVLDKSGAVAVVVLTVDAALRVIEDVDGKSAEKHSTVEAGVLKYYN